METATSSEALMTIMAPHPRRRRENLKSHISLEWLTVELFNILCTAFI
jgi:hypothetical protein